MANTIPAELDLETHGEPKGAPTSERFAAETAHHHPSTDHTTDDEEIRAEAYELWVAEGRPEGKQEEHWSLAERRVQSRKRRSGR